MKKILKLVLAVVVGMMVVHVNAALNSKFSIQELDPAHKYTDVLITFNTIEKHDHLSTCWHWNKSRVEKEGSLPIVEESGRWYKLDKQPVRLLFPMWFSSTMPHRLSEISIEKTLLDYYDKPEAIFSYHTNDNNIEYDSRCISIIRETSKDSVMQITVNITLIGF